MRATSSPLLQVIERDEPAAGRVLVLGIDPGASGALAFYDPRRPAEITVYDAPLVDNAINAAAFADLIRQTQPTLAILERVGSMPKQGVSSTFKFGMAYGAAQGIVAALLIPHRFVTPQTWKRHYRLPGGDEGKEKGRALAVQMWPASKDFARKKDHGRADAALLARFGAETFL